MKLPLGIQDFVSIREDGCYYADKTAYIHRLLAGSGKAFFLSRPRRFGKSLLCSTLAAVFEGRRELFSGLAIDGLDWNWKKYPVVRIDLNSGDYARGTGELFATINWSLEFCANKYNTPLEGETISNRFARLIYNLHKNCDGKVAVIIDEYDKPLLNTLDNREIHEEMRNALKAFYGVLKSCDEHLKFVFLTGVSKFSQVSVFSDLNNLTDISLDSRYTALCGITQEELERDFGAEIERIARESKMEKDEYLAELRRFYNGYRFSENPVTVYNPFGLLNHFDKDGRFDVYWFATGTPTFLIKLIEQQRVDILNLERETVSVHDFYRFNADNMSAVPVLYQTGYLTISSYDEEDRTFTLDYPNEEVRAAFARSLVETYMGASEPATRALVTMLPKLLRKGDIEGALGSMIPFFAEIPYDITIKREKYYQTVIHLIFRMIGLSCKSEVRTASGRIDSVVETPKYVYCFEFKLDGSAVEALEQINSKEYLLPWEGSGKALIKAGVSFSASKRNIDEWVIERV